MARLYSNENFPRQVVEALLRLGHDVLTIQETGKVGQCIPDEDVLAFASAENRAALTLNRKHFIRLRNERPGHAGIAVCTFDPNFLGQASRIHAALDAQANLASQLIRINRPAA